jgi:mRNA interferase MazF
VIAEGQVVLLRFPQTDLGDGKLRPALVLRRMPGPFDDWLICMLSTRLQRATPGLDEVIRESDPDFAQTGLKTASLVRVTRLAVVATARVEGRLGQVASQRLERLRRRLAKWIAAGVTAPDG